MMEVQLKCTHCCEVSFHPYSLGATLNCPKCDNPLLIHPTDNFLSHGILDQCPFCGCPELYRQKDFNRRLGLLLVVIGVLLAYWTRGLSLLLVAIIDWCLYRFVGWVGCCYQCHTVFRGFADVDNLKSFNLEFFDHFRSRVTA